MSYRFEILSIVRFEISKIWYPAIQLSTTVVFTLFLLPVLPIQAQQLTHTQVSTITVRAKPTKPSLGLDGYCCVSLTDLDGTTAAWVKGKPHIGINHRDRIYLFSNQQNLQLFLSNPDKFSPVLSGFDPVLFTDHRRLIDGQRKYGVAFKKRLYLFQNEYTLRAFWNSPDRYAKAALDAMNRAR